MVASSGFASRCFWWTISSSADVWTVCDSVNGVTVGQVSVGPVTNADDDTIGNYGFWNDFFGDFTLCFEIVDTSLITIDTIWNTDTLTVSSTITMVAGEQFVITNCGDCHIGFGLEGVGTAPCDWSFGAYNELDRCVVRAVFDNNPDPPVVFNRTHDYIKRSLTWANETKFGPDGFDLGLYEYYNLWMKFETPTRSSCYGVNIITIRVWGRSYLP